MSGLMYILHLWMFLVLLEQKIHPIHLAQEVLSIKRPDSYYWNDHILSDYNTIDDFNYDEKKSKELREFGLGG